jgi:hypothetical protein
MPTLTRLVVGGAVALILFFGVYPDPIVRLARASSSLEGAARPGEVELRTAAAPPAAPISGQ